LASPAKKFYTPEEYLAYEATADHRSEYFHGEIYAMAGGSANHNQIVVNLVVALETAFERKPCRVFANDMRLLVKRDGLYTYPDIVVICGRIEFAPGRTDTVTNPTLIIEVWSESTKDYDRGSKFAIYRQLPTLQEYVMIDQARVYVESFRRVEGAKWLLESYEQREDQLQLHSLELELPLHKIYNKVDWQVEG
jgi:Uma2 family endonuclease